MNYSNDSADPDPSHGEDDLCNTADAVVKWMWSTIAPFIVIIGLLGNLLVIIVFERLHFRKSSTLLHMFVLAFNDSVILSLGPVRYWTREVFQFDLATVSDFGCRLNFFVLYTSLDFSAWILVSVSVERVVSVHKPLHARIWFTVNRAVIRLVVIFVLLCGLNMHFFFTNGLVSDSNDTSYENDTGINTTTTTNDSQTCDSLPEFYVFNNYYFTWIDLFFDSLFPFVLMALSNCFIVKSLRQSKRNRPRTMTRRALQQQTGRGHRVEDTSMSQDGFESEDQATPQPNGHIVTEVYESGVYEQPRSSADEDAFENDREGGSCEVRESEGVSSNGSSNSVAPEQTYQDALSRGGNHVRMEDDVHGRNEIVLDRGGDSYTGRPTTNVRPARQQEPLPKPVPVISWGVTRMLVLVTTIFLVTTLPNSVYYIVDTFLYNYEATCSRTNAILDMVKVVTNLLQYSNYGINFWLYSSRSNRFRMEVKYMLGLVGSRFRRHFKSSVLSGTASAPQFRSQQRQEASVSDRQTSSVKSQDSSRSTKGMILRRSNLKNSRNKETTSVLPREDQHYVRRPSAGKIYYNEDGSEVSDQRSHVTAASSSSHEKSGSGQELLELKQRTNDSRIRTTILSGLQESEFRPEYAEINDAEVVSFAETSRTNDIVTSQESHPDLEATQHGPYNQRFKNSRRERRDLPPFTGGDERSQQQLSVKLLSPEDIERGGRPAQRQANIFSLETKDLPEIVCPNCEKRPHFENSSLSDEPEASEVMVQGAHEVICCRL